MNVTLRRSIAVAAVLLVPLASSCGFDRPTDRVYTPGVGVNNRAGTVDVLNAVVVSGEDGSGTVVATFVNNERVEGDAVTRIAGSGQDAGITVTLDSPVELAPGGAAKIPDEVEAPAEGAGITPGTFVELTFSFERGENVVLEAPVVANTGEYSDIPLSTGSPSPSPGEESPSPSPEESPSPTD